MARRGPRKTVDLQDPVAIATTIERRDAEAIRAIYGSRGAAAYLRRLIRQDLRAARAALNMALSTP